MDLPKPGRCTVNFALGGRAEKDLTALRNPRALAQFCLRFERLTQGLEADGKISIKQYRKLNGHRPIDEIKSSGNGPAYRCFCFKEGTTYWLTHCEEKKGNSGQWYAQQAKTANKIRKKHIEKIGGIKNANP